MSPLAAAGPPASDLPPAQAARVWHAAKAFEGMTLGALLAPVFATVGGARGMFGGGSAEAMWRPMLVQEIGKELAAGGGLGLAVPVFRAMVAAQEARDRAAHGARRGANRGATQGANHGATRTGGMR